MGDLSEHCFWDRCQHGYDPATEDSECAGPCTCRCHHDAGMEWDPIDQRWTRSAGLEEDRG